jgi:hypothetical protein
MRSKAQLQIVKFTKPERPSTGLEPYFALERRPSSKPRATNPDRYWQVLVAFVVGVVLLAAGFFR